MRIANIEAIPLRIPFAAAGRSDNAVWGKGGLQTVDSLLVRVTTDTGVVGWGESFGFTAVPAAKRVIDKLLALEATSRDATQVEKLMLRLAEEIPCVRSQRSFALRTLRHKHRAMGHRR